MTKLAPTGANLSEIATKLDQLSREIAVLQRGIDDILNRLPQPPPPLQDSIREMDSREDRFDLGFDRALDPLSQLIHLTIRKADRAFKDIEAVRTKVERITAQRNPDYR